VILDFGFWERHLREEARSRGQKWGARVELHAVECTEETMLKRTLARTSTLPQGALEINAEAFETLKKRFQPLTEEERRQATIISIGNEE
jgi:predicted kinase